MSTGLTHRSDLDTPGSPLSDTESLTACSRWWPAPRSPGSEVRDLYAHRDQYLFSCPASGTLMPMTTRRTVPVQIDVGTVALAELAAAHQGMSVAEWIARAARREVVRISPSSNYVELTAAEMLAEDAERAADEATIAAEEAKRFRAAG